MKLAQKTPIAVRILEGGEVFSAFRMRQLLRRLQASNPHIKNLKARFYYWIKFTKDYLEQDNAKNLSRLLQAQEIDLNALNPHNLACWAVPRLGTISPWSSKASDIAHICGFEFIERIERGMFYELITDNSIASKDIIFNSSIRKILHDPLTESLLFHPQEFIKIFAQHTSQTYSSLDVLAKGKAALEQVNAELGLALSEVELNYLCDEYRKMQRNPTDVELMMFSQVNSEHCRHKIFNAQWEINGIKQERSLFSMIRNTMEKNPNKVLVAYKDNAAVIKGVTGQLFFLNPKTQQYSVSNETIHYLLKVETHNHPTAISPFPGAATGSGGEIRDEAATGIGAFAKAGICGFSVSHLLIPDFIQPWEINMGKSSHMASALEIMLEAPVGAAAFNNEFGRPNICGYFRSFLAPLTPALSPEYRGEGEALICSSSKGDSQAWPKSPLSPCTQEERDRVRGCYYGYHKPIMIAGGIGTIRDSAVHKKEISKNAKLIVLGGPSMSIGLGGGAASSKTMGQNSAELDFASVQRANPEMQRRCQEVINACWSLGHRNPILSVHDVGAGGLSNALPEIVESARAGARILLRDIPTAESGMSPLAIWCNEAQERYVLAIESKDIKLFQQICERERCPYAVVGELTEEKNLLLEDKQFTNKPVNLPMSVLFDHPIKLHFQLQTEQALFHDSSKLLESPLSACTQGERDRVRGIYAAKQNEKEIICQSKPVIREKLAQCIQQVLQFPTVASKNFLITIGDRTVGGLTARDQMVGPWQIPVSDLGVTANDYVNYTGQALAMGERSPLAVFNAEASARMAVGEAITNLSAAAIENIAEIVLSANWMAAADKDEEKIKLFNAVKTVGMELCPALGINIPVGKDSLSMRSVFETDKKIEVRAPLSLIITAAANTYDVRKTLTPQLRNLDQNTHLILIDLSEGKNRLGASILYQTLQLTDTQVPDLNSPEILKNFFNAIQEMQRKDLLLAYHDRSDGGLIACLCEMMFASHVTMQITLDGLGEEYFSILFNEELGAVIQVEENSIDHVYSILKKFNLHNIAHIIGRPTETENNELIIHFKDQEVYREKRIQLQAWWSETSYRMQALRDNPECARQEYENMFDEKDPGMQARLTFNPAEKIFAAHVNLTKPKVAILREQGVNGQREMAAAFSAAGFDCFDVHMSDLIHERIKLEQFSGLAACGGFSYGDVLGAGRGWAQSILLHKKVRDQFQQFFARNNTFALGICNGCQMLSQLKEIIPGAEHWPTFQRNVSEQFEARFSLVKISRSPSLFFDGMADSVIPVVISHGEGRAIFSSASDQENSKIALQYVDHYHKVTERYPFNPNGSPQGIAGVTSKDGRVTLLMPHPERVFRTVQNSWYPAEWKEFSPWMTFFRNAFKWI